MSSISINKNSVPGDQSALQPGGIRIGTAAITTRGMNVGDMQQIAHFLDKALKISISIQKSGAKLLKDFTLAAEVDERVRELRGDVERLAVQFPMPGGY